MYSYTLPSTSAVDGVDGQRHAPASLLSGKDPVPIEQETGWAPGPVWMGAENLASHLDSIPRPSSPQRVTIPAALSRPLSHHTHVQFNSLYHVVHSKGHRVVEKKGFCNQRCTNLGRQVGQTTKFCTVVFLCPQNVTCPMSPFWHP